MTQRVYDTLRLKIIRGEITSGSRLAESVIAEQMKVSRTPVREALQKLALEGFVYSIPRAGYMVEEISEYDIIDLFRTRTAIEQVAARWSIERISDEEIKHLEQNLQETDRIIKSGKTEKMIDLDRDFHHTIYKTSGSKTLYEICKTLSDHTLKFRYACIHIAEIASRARNGHFEILSAIKSRNPDMVDDAILAHLEESKEDILNYLREMRQMNDWD